MSTQNSFLSSASSSSPVIDDPLAIAPDTTVEILSGSGTRVFPRVSRRNFIASFGMGTAGTLGFAGCSSSSTPTPTTPPTTTPAPTSPPVTTTPPSPTPTPTPTPPPTTAPPAPSVVDVLNFALNLEYLEASFYSYVATGNGLLSADLGVGAGSITGFGKVTFTNPTVAVVAQALATDELDHVRFLRATISKIGGTPVAAPSLNLAAMGSVTSDASFLMLARQLETVGVSAYAGGAQFLTSNTAALTYAAQILDTEAQHEGNLRQLCIALGVSSPAVDGSDTPPSGTAVFNTSPTTGLNPVRTTSQVLQIVYAAAGKTGVASGGFFPNGLNGTIKIS